MKRRLFVRTLGLCSLAATIAVPAVVASPASASVGSLGAVNHIVVIYEENHSFDNLYGLWGDVNGQHVHGSGDATSVQKTQVNQAGTPYTCLYQNEVNLSTSREAITGGALGSLPAQNGPLAPSCNDKGSANTFSGSQVNVPFNSAFGNAPFKIDTYIPSTAKTCVNPANPPALTGSKGYLPQPAGNTNFTAGGCTEDIVHRFYQEQYQLDAGKQDRYTVGSDVAGMTQGYYDTTQLPIWQYLHGVGAPNYVIEDNMFQGAFGGSYANHQELISASLPSYGASAPTGYSNTVLDANGMPTKSYPLYTSPASTTLTDSAISQACGLPTTLAGELCGNYAINTAFSTYQPTPGGTAVLPPLNDTVTPMNIGDLLSNASVSWAWYSGGWDNAAGNTSGPGWTNGAGAAGSPCIDPAVASGKTLPLCPDRLFQFHHQPFNYFQRYAPGTADRATHLQDEKALFTETGSGATETVTMTGTLPAVAFIKPIGEENEHPGYTSESNGSAHLVKTIQALLDPAHNPDAATTMIVVTYDEFGGQWDHVAPPGTAANPANPATGAPADQFGPGTRIPGLVISPALVASGVDGASHDTVSVLSTIENRFLGGQATTHLSTRDQAVNDFGTAFTVVPTTSVPETPWAVLLSVSALAVLAGGVLMLRRKPSGQLAI